MVAKWHAAATARAWGVTMLVLTAMYPDGREKVLRVRGGGREVIGRRAPRLKLDDTRVSRRHARVWCERGQWWIEDLDSTHGTRVNHDTIDRPTPLYVGDEIRLGRMLLIVREADAGQAHPRPAMPRAKPAPHAA